MNELGKDTGKGAGKGKRKPKTMKKKGAARQYFVIDVSRQKAKKSAIRFVRAPSGRLIEKIQEGLDYDAIEELSSEIGLPIKEMAGFANIPPRTLARRKAEGQLQPDESDRVARMGMLFEEALRLFEGDQARAAQWFRSPKKALGGASPIEYARTEPGTWEVRDLIGRLEHGVFS